MLNTYTIRGHDVSDVKLRRTGYRQYCGLAQAHVEIFRPEGVDFGGARFTFRAKVYYVCGREHFEHAVREEARAEIHEQWEAHVLTLRTNGSADARLVDRSGQEPTDAQGPPTIEWMVSVINDN